MRSSLVVLFAGVAGFWAVAAWLGVALADDGDNRVLAYSATAAGVCVLPSALTLAWALWNKGQNPEQQRLIVLGGTGVRMFFVLGVGLLLHLAVPLERPHQIAQAIAVQGFAVPGNPVPVVPQVAVPLEVAADEALIPAVPYFRRQSFWTWLLIFYLFTLALEMGIVLRRLARRDGEAKGTPAADSPTRSV